MRLPHTDATDEAEKDHSSQYIPDQVGLAGAVESGGRAVLLVVVRRLGHAAGRISIRGGTIAGKGMRTVREAS